MNLFKKDPKKKLAKQYEKLMQEAYKLSTVNRRLSDEKYAEAEEVVKKIEALKNQKA
ncbi:Lacal_2735 family protein [Marinilabilia rubra]|nr:Lacal_2735 family protein [Marinilabilia rubra]